MASYEDVEKRWNGARPPWPDRMSLEEYLSHDLEWFDKLPPDTR